MESMESSSKVMSPSTTLGRRLTARKRTSGSQPPLLRKAYFEDLEDCESEKSMKSPRQSEDSMKSPRQSEDNEPKGIFKNKPIVDEEETYEERVEKMIIADERNKQRATSSIRMLFSPGPGQIKKPKQESQGTVDDEAKKGSIRDDEAKTSQSSSSSNRREEEGKRRKAKEEEEKRIEEEVERRLRKRLEQQQEEDHWHQWHGTYEDQWNQWHYDEPKIEEEENPGPKSPEVMMNPGPKSSESMSSESMMMMKMLEMNMEMQKQMLEIQKLSTTGRQGGEEKFEEVKTTIVLPKLEMPDDETAAVVCGDWIARINPLIGSMTKNSKAWWEEVNREVQRAYKSYSVATPLQRLEIWPKTESEVKWEQLEQKVSHSLLEALEGSLVSEIVASRKVDPRSILFKVLILYQPGGIKEKALLVKYLQETKTETQTKDAISSLREWERRKKRAEEVGLVLPDPSIQVKALDKIVSTMMDADPRVQFRVQLARTALEVDTDPSEEKVNRYLRVLQAELTSMETIVKEKPKGTETPQVKPVTIREGKDKGFKGEGKKGGGKKGFEGKGKSDLSAVPCRWYQSEKGCFRGGDCIFMHGYLKFEDGKCFNCGSKEHKGTECPAPKKKPREGKGNAPDYKGGKKGAKGDEKGASKGKTQIRYLEVEQPSLEGQEQSSSSSSQRTLKPNTSDTTEPETEPREPLLNQLVQFQKLMVKALQAQEKKSGPEDLEDILKSLKKANMKTIRVKSTSIKTDRRGLIDSGATNPVRELESEEELMTCQPVNVEVAFKEEVESVLMINEWGTVIGPQGTETILPMNDMVQWLKCNVTWKDHELTIVHPEHGDLEVEVINGTPYIDNQLCLDLIKDVETKKKNGAMMTVKTVKVEEEKGIIEKIWEPLKRLIKWMIREGMTIKALTLLKAATIRKRREDKNIDDEEGRRGIVEEMMRQVEERKDKDNLKVLLEFCCDPDSLMTEEYRQQGGASFRFGLPQYNLLEENNILLINELMDELQRRDFTPIVWGSIPCSPWCSWQRVNCATIEGHPEKLKAQREESLKLVDNFKKIIEHADQNKCICPHQGEEEPARFYFEWPRFNDGWKQPALQELAQLLPATAIFDGCAYDLYDEKGKPLKKEWKVISNDEDFPKRMNRKCPGHPSHGQVRGKGAKNAGRYTLEMIEEVIKAFKSEGEVRVKGFNIRQHRQEAHFPFDARCEECLKGGMKNRPHRRQPPRKENTLALDVAGRFEKGIDGSKYFLVGAFTHGIQVCQHTQGKISEDFVQKGEDLYEKIDGDVFTEKHEVEEAEICRVRVKMMKTSKEAVEEAKEELDKAKQPKEATPEKTKDPEVPPPRPDTPTPEDPKIVPKWDESTKAFKFWNVESEEWMKPEEVKMKKKEEEESKTVTAKKPQEVKEREDHFRTILRIPNLDHSEKSEEEVEEVVEGEEIKEPSRGSTEGAEIPQTTKPKEGADIPPITKLKTKEELIAEADAICKAKEKESDVEFPVGKPFRPLAEIPKKELPRTAYEFQRFIRRPFAYEALVSMDIEPSKLRDALYKEEENSKREGRPMVMQNWTLFLEKKKEKQEQELLKKKKENEEYNQRLKEQRDQQEKKRREDEAQMRAKEGKKRSQEPKEDPKSPQVPKTKPVEPKQDQPKRQVVAKGSVTQVVAKGSVTQTQPPPKAAKWMGQSSIRTAKKKEQEQQAMKLAEKYHEKSKEQRKNQCAMECRFLIPAESTSSASTSKDVEILEPCMGECLQRQGHQGPCTCMDHLHLVNTEATMKYSKGVFYEKPAKKSSESGDTKAEPKRKDTLTFEERVTLKPKLMGRKMMMRKSPERSPPRKKIELTKWVRSVSLASVRRVQEKKKKVQEVSLSEEESLTPKKKAKKEKRKRVHDPTEFIPCKWDCNQRTKLIIDDTGRKLQFCEEPCWRQIKHVGRCGCRLHLKPEYLEEAMRLRGIKSNPPEESAPETRKEKRSEVKKSQEEDTTKQPEVTKEETKGLWSWLKKDEEPPKEEKTHIAEESRTQEEKKEIHEKPREKKKHHRKRRVESSNIYKAPPEDQGLSAEEVIAKYLNEEEKKEYGVEKKIKIKAVRVKAGRTNQLSEPAEVAEPAEVELEEHQEDFEEEVLRALQEELSKDDENFDENTESFEKKRTVILVRTLKSRKAEDITAAIQDMVIQLEQGLGLRLERIHTDCATEFESQRFKRWCQEKGYRRTTNNPEDPQGNGSAEASVGLIKREARTLLNAKAAKGIPLTAWPYAVQHVAQCRWQRHMYEKRQPLEFGQTVMIRRRKRTNVASGKDWLPVAIEGRYMGRNPEVAGEGHLVMIQEAEREPTIVRTSRVVPITQEEEEEKEQFFLDQGWKWTTDPDGNTFWIHKTGLKQWEEPLLLEDEESPKEEEPNPRRRLREKTTPEGEWMKAKQMRTKPDEEEDYEEDDDDEQKYDDEPDENEEPKTKEEEVTRTIPLQEVMMNLEEWKEAIGAELNSQYQKGSLRKIDKETKEELMRRSDVRIIPAKGVFVKKPTKLKCRIVACGNYEPKETHEDNYAGGADATAIRTALRRSALRGWTIAGKDVSTAFLNAEYSTAQGILLLTPPKVVTVAGFMNEGEAWIVERAIYGLRESPKLWSMERDDKLRKMRIKVGKKFLKLHQMKADANSWHILDGIESVGLVNTYVDDILVMSTKEITQEVMDEIDRTWKCTEAEYLDEAKELKFCGMTLQKVPEGIILHQKGLHLGNYQKKPDGRLESIKDDFRSRRMRGNHHRKRPRADDI